MLKVRVQGFTLLELLIALSLSVMLMTVLVVGLNQITRDWQKQGGKLDQKIDDALVLLQLEKAILGTYGYHFKEQQVSKEFLLFEGTENELKWVSTVSPNRNSQLTLWFLKIHGNKGFELRVFPISSADINKQLEKPEEHPNYYFANHTLSLHYLSSSVNDQKDWSSHWSGKTKKSFPLGVRLKLVPNDDNSDNDNKFSMFSFIRAEADIASITKKRGRRSRNIIQRNNTDTPQNNSSLNRNPFQGLIR
jgi:general secretion pathway protein J